MTRLAYARYLQLLRDDGERLAAAAEGRLELPVPTCPGWDVAEVVRHTGSVFLHKVVWLRIGRRPEQDEWQSRPSDGEPLLTWYGGALAGILSELSTRTAETPASTWWPPEQHAGFWARRMALETVVHRRDVESAVAQPTPVDAALAADGIDEVLCIMLDDPELPAQEGETLGDVEVSCEGNSWLVRMQQDGVSVSDSESATGVAAASLTGDPAALFLYLWGRGPLDGLSSSGDPALVRALRRRLAAATQ